MIPVVVLAAAITAVTLLGFIAVSIADDQPQPYQTCAEILAVTFDQPRAREVWQPDLELARARHQLALRDTLADHYQWPQQQPAPVPVLVLPRRAPRLLEGAAA